MSKAEITRAHQAVQQATADVLAGRPSTLDAAALGGRRPLSVATMISGMGPLMGYWAEQGTLKCDGESRELLRQFLENSRHKAYKMETALANILSVCASRSIKPNVLKGALTAQRYFPEPGTRPSADIDLLVRSEELPETRRALTEAGFEQLTQPSFGTEVWRPAGASADVVSIDMEHAQNPWSVDLHTSIDRPYFRGHWTHFGSAPFAYTEQWVIRQQKALVFTQPMLFAHLIQHASRDIVRLRLLRLVELVFVVRQDKRLRWDACLRLLESSGITRYVFPALAMTETLAPETIDPGFLTAIRDAAPTGLIGTVERLQHDPLRSFFRRSPAERLMWTNGFHEKLLAWSDVLWPTGHSFDQQLRIMRRRVRMLTGS